MKITDINNKYIIVVKGDEKKVVYDVDDRSIFSVHITGTKRGARNAVISNKTFKTFAEAFKGIQYLETCHFNCKFTMINVSELKSYSEIGYNYLMNDIDQYNKDIDSINELKKQERNKANSILKAQRERVIKLINSGVCFIVNEEVLEF